MGKLNETIVEFFHKQPFTVLTTIGEDGYPHTSCKGIVSIEQDKIFLLDVYKAKTYENLQKNPNVNITAVNEHKFVGYTLKGKACLVKRADIREHIIKAWEEKVTKRISARILKNLHGEKGHARHPETLLPKPEYLIVVDIEDVVDLTPRHMREPS